VALALGSGGARGYAHIGVIDVLEERGFEIASVAGSSMGALVGGLNAAGKLAPYAEWARGLRQRDVVRLLDVSLSAPGAIRAEKKILARVRELLAGALIEDLPIPFTAVATDLLARKEVWFQRGPVDVAIRASIAIPTVITPVMLNGRLLADGALTNPVPIAPTASAQADVTVAVSVGADPEQVGVAPVRETAEPRPVEEWTERFRAGASQLFDRESVRTLLGRFGNGSRGVEGSRGDGDGATDPFGELPAGLGKLDMMNQSLDTMQSILTRYRLAGYPPDVLISVPRDACRSLEFHRAAEMIDVGRRLAAQALDRAGLVSGGPVPDAPPAAEE
jgi:NTE family protein